MEKSKARLTQNAIAKIVILFEEAGVYDLPRREIADVTSYKVQISKTDIDVEDQK